MWRRGSSSLLGRAVAGLQQHAAAAAAVQQPCLQMEALACLQQAVRHKRSMPKQRSAETNAIKEAMRRERAFRRAEELRRQAAPPAAPSLQAPDQAAAEPAGPSSSSSSSPAAAADADSSHPTRSPLSSLRLQPPPEQPQEQAAAAAPPAEASSSSSSSSGGKSWTPSWLRQMFDGRGGGGAGRVESSPSPLAQAAPPSEEEGAGGAAPAGDQPASKKDGWEDLHKFKDLSLDEYMAMIKNEPGAEDFEAAPRPMTPPRGPRAYYNRAYDVKRVRYMRYEQHVGFISTLSPEDKLKVKLDRDVLQNEATLNYLCDVSQYSRSIVIDTIYCYRQRADMLRRLHEHRSAGKPMPLIGDSVAREELLEKLEEQELKARERKLLKERDVGACQLRLRARLTPNNPHNMTCPQTQLRFIDCCGRNSKAHTGRRHARR